VARIVLIDDEDELRETLIEILAAAGHQVFGAPGGKSGLEAIRRERPDLIICDVRMPGVDGYGVLDALRRDEELAGSPFLFLTGEGEIDHVRAGMNLGADDYLVKPISVADLVGAVDARLRRRQLGKLESERRLEEVRNSLALLLPHELRTPLTGILGCGELLQKYHAEMGPAEIQEMADAIVTSGRRLQRMTENYLLYAGLQLQRLARAETPAAPSRDVSSPQDVREAATERAAEHGRPADLELDLQDTVLPVPAPYLRKIVAELADNAFKFSKAGQKVTLSLRRADPEVVLEIGDSGRGMTAAQIADVNAFRQFERAFFEQQGSGLGLVLVRSILEASSGALELVSRPEAGTRARVRWLSGPA